MKKENLILIVYLFSFCNLCHGQNPKTKYYYVTKKGHCFCDTLSYSTNIQGFLSEINFVDLNGKSVKMEGKENVPNVLTFYLNGITTDKIYTIPDKPSKYTKYIERVVDGKLRVYLRLQEFDAIDGSAMGLYKFYLKMPDETFYQINDKGNMNKYIKPYLLKCTEFANSFKGDFSMQREPFMETIRLYNSLCQ
ncbi:MAG: hypothetical protein IPG39_11790 [Bacteroidetes bacterium]|nr:hypothetical protein [Bacteroidota bacterium]